MLSPSAVFGVGFIVSNLIPETVCVPVKKYPKKQWMLPSRCVRMQKKWNKRYGTTIALNYIMIGGSIYAHKNVIEKLKNAYLKQM